MEGRHFIQGSKRAVSKNVLMLIELRFQCFKSETETGIQIPKDDCGGYLLACFLSRFR
jgi:hypothetical protein